jgi:hypothetical protein
MNTSTIKKGSVFAGFSLMSLVVLIVSGFLLKNQAVKTAQPILHKLSEVPQEAWFKSLSQWLKECPIKAEVHPPKALEAQI